MNLKTFSQSEFRDEPTKVLAEAIAAGRVRIVDESGRSFLLRPEGVSPLDVPIVRVKLSREEIVQLVRDEREDKPIRKTSMAKTRKTKRNVKTRGAA